MPKLDIAADADRLLAIEIARARMDLGMYGVLTRGIKPARHHKGIIDAVHPKTWNRGSAVVCPPGSGKSTWISEMAPAWLIGNDPTKLILHLHANDEKANAYLTTIQQIYQTNEFHKQIFPDVEPDFDRGWSSRGLYFKWRDLTGKWRIKDNEGWSHQGAKDPQYVSLGFGGGAIGRRADTIILDDPFDPNEIHSATFRNRFEHRFRTVILSRLKPNGRVIFVCNRWHHDDIVPKLKEIAFDLVTFPAIIGNEDGSESSYWPEIWELKKLQEIRDRDLGPTEFQCLYQGSPGGEDGAIIHAGWFKYVYVDEHARYFRILGETNDEVIPFKQCRWFQAIDPAASERTSADYFVIATVAMDPKGRFFVVDVIRKRLQGPDQPDLVRAAHDYWHPYGIGVEKSGYQLTLVQLLRRQGLPIVELPRYSDKMSRHLTLASRYKVGIIYHRKGAEWLKDLEIELTEIPRSRHDDQADALADAIDGLGQRTANIQPHQRSRMLVQAHQKFMKGRW